MIKVYWSPKTRAFRAIWMLEEVGAAYERVLVDIRNGQQDEAWFRRINPMRKIPALEDGPVTVADSAAICLYLADRYPAAQLAPAINAPDRGRYLQWMMFNGSVLEPAIMERANGTPPKPAQAGWGDLDRALDALRAGLDPGPYLLGQRFSAADLVLGGGLNWLMQFGLVPREPLFEAYAARCVDRPAFAKASAAEAAPA